MTKINDLPSAPNAIGTADLFVLDQVVAAVLGTYKADGTALRTFVQSNLGTVAFEAMPAAGFVYSTGTHLAQGHIGAGLTLDGTTHTLANTGVLALVQGTGMSITGTVASETITNAGVLSFTQGTITTVGTMTVGANITLNAGGTLSAASPGAGTVTSVVGGTGLSGGTITSAGTLAVTAATTAALGGIIAGANTTINVGGTLSVAAPGTGSVTSIIAGSGLGGGTITTSGTFTNAGVLAIAATTGSIVLGTHLAMSGQTLDTTGYGTMAVQNANSVAITGGTITGLGTPSASSDAAPKSYVDAAIAGLQIKPTATVATTAALPTNIYLAGVITVTATGTTTVDGHVLALGDLVLVKNEAGAAAANNGLYNVTTAGAIGVATVLTRNSEMNTAAEIPGAFIPVGNIGTVNANSLWLANPTTPVTLGTTLIPFTQLNGATDLVQGTGITISGNTISNAGIITLVGVTNQTTISNGNTIGMSPVANFHGQTITLANIAWGGGAVAANGTIALIPNMRPSVVVTEADWSNGGGGTITASLRIGGATITSLGALTVSNTSTAAATGANTIAAGGSLDLVLSGLTGTIGDGGYITVIGTIV